MPRFKAEPARFDWPEPLVIEIVVERYQDVADEAARMSIARLQATALRERFAGRSRQAAALRPELIAACAARGITALRVAACAARGITALRVARTDIAVLFELTQIAMARFRTSPRLRSEVCARLEAALSQLDARVPRPASATG